MDAQGRKDPRSLRNCYLTEDPEEIRARRHLAGAEAWNCGAGRARRLVSGASSAATQNVPTTSRGCTAATRIVDDLGLPGRRVWDRTLWVLSQH